MKQISKNFSNSENIYIPKVHCTYLTSKVMIMERIYGIPINDKKSLISENISFEEIAEKSVELFFVQVFEHNFFHADMHPEIYLFKNIMILSDSFLLILALWVR